MIRLPIFLLILFSVSTFSKTKDLKGAWAGVFSNKELNSSFFWSSEVQSRYSLDGGSLGQFLYRTGLNLKHQSSSTSSVLYGYITSENVKEHRWTLQFATSYYDKNDFKVSSRSRVEYRNIEDNDDDSLRYRYLLRADYSDFIVWDEAFINLTKDDWTGDRSFDRNRFFFGKKLSVFDSKIEYGYLNQYVPRKDMNISEHILVLYFFM